MIEVEAIDRWPGGGGGEDKERRSQPALAVSVQLVGKSDRFFTIR